MPLVGEARAGEQWAVLCSWEHSPELFERVLRLSPV